jgi:3-hydroxyacyl-[acyl-carrier-protein] dehydratase
MSKAAGQIDAVDITAILKMLPHRYPFLMVDKVVDIRGEQHGVGIKNITFNEPQFAGHFPGNPVFPGVLLIEGMAQTAGVLCYLAWPDGSPPAYVYFLTIDQAKFRRPVVPGDTVEYHMNLLRRRKNIWWYRGEAKVGATLVAEATVSAMMTDR